MHQHYFLPKCRNSSRQKAFLLSFLKDRRLCIYLHFSMTKGYYRTITFSIIQKTPVYSKTFFVASTMTKYDCQKFTQCIQLIQQQATRKRWRYYVLYMCLSKYMLHNSNVKFFQIQTTCILKHKCMKQNADLTRMIQKIPYSS